MGGAKNRRALARPNCVSKPLTKFCWILSSGLGGDSIMDRRTEGRTDGRTDRRMEAITISLKLFLKSVGITTPECKLACKNINEVVGVIIKK